MKPISSRLHGVLDYVVGLLLIIAPFALDFADHGPAMWVPIALGATTIVYSLFTQYEYGLVPALPLRVHLVIDALGGVLLAASPWLFGFADLVWVPHVVVGLFELAVVAMTRTVDLHTNVHPGSPASA